MQPLDTYIKLVPFLGNALGENVEIALHDLTKPNAPIIAIANNHLSGRVIGDGLTSLGEHILKEKQYETRDYVMNYKSQTENGRLLRASSYFIRDEEGHLTGMLCVNVDISDYEYLNTALKRILGIKDESEMEYQRDHPIEILSGSIAATIQQCVQETLAEMGFPNYMQNGRLTADEKLQVVKALHDKGIFNIKGAISCVAKELAASEPTIYRYLKKI